MDIAEAEQCHFVRFRFLAVDWIPEEQQYINFIAGNASCNLLIAALSAAEITLDFQTGCFTDQFPVVPVAQSLWRDKTPQYAIQN